MALDASILGISFDTPDDNRIFAAANRFSFLLLSDPERTAGQAYGVARDPDHRYRDYPRRVTFVIDPDGVIRLVYLVAPSQIPGHADRVLEDMTSLIAAT